MPSRRIVAVWALVAVKLPATTADAGARQHGKLAKPLRVDVARQT